jgi:phosphoglycerate dehydrogenase-like enzyme
MTVIGTRRSYRPGHDHPDVDELRGTADLHDVLARCDAVVVSAPGTPETENLFDKDAFAAMKPGAVFCNVGRGSLVDEAALIDALESGHLGAAILDVTRHEPLPADDPLWDAPNIWISPHSSASQDRYTEKLLALFAHNLGRFTRGEPLRNVVDRAAGY